MVLDWAWFIWTSPLATSSSPLSTLGASLPVEADGPTLFFWSRPRYSMACFWPPKSCIALMRTAVPSPATPGVEYWSLFSYFPSSRSSQVAGACFSSLVLWTKPK